MFVLASQRAVGLGLFEALSDILKMLPVSLLISFRRTELPQRLREGGSRVKGEGVELVEESCSESGC